MKYILVFIITSLVSPNLIALDSESTAMIEAAAKTAASKAVEEKSFRDFHGLRLGVGLSLTVDTGYKDRVASAEIVDGIVRINKEQDKVARIMLESHYFFPTKTKRFLGLVDPGKWGWGPFFAVQPGTEEIIEAIGFGIMVGFRRGANSDNSWNMGLGYVVDPEVQILGDGFIENQAPPGSETTVRFKTKSQQGAFLIFSTSF